MLQNVCNRCFIYAGSLLRTSKHFILDGYHRNVTYFDVKSRAFLAFDRKLSSVSKTISTSKSEDCNKQRGDNREEVSPLHDKELQKFMEEIKKDFGEQPDVKESIEQDKSDERSNSNDVEDCGAEKSPKNFKLNSEEYTSLPLSIREKFKQYKDDDSNVIRSAEETPQEVSSWKQKVIEVEEEQELYLYQQKFDKIDYLSLERGKRGVFDIEQLVSTLKQENTQHVAVIKIPPSLHYCDYMVLATAKSARHLEAVADFIRRLHKKKKYQKEPFLKIEGEDCKDWKAIDMGHIVIHLFLQEAREIYDIETLWTVGEKYDPLSNQKADPYEDLLKEHMEFLQNTQPLTDIK